MTKALRSIPIIVATLALACSSQPPEQELPTFGRYEGHESVVAATVAERDLIPEGIARDASTGKLYLSSFRKSKIVEVNAGTSRDFIDEHAHGFQAGVGMRVDSRRRVLWACSATAPHMRDYDASAPAVKGIYRFDLDSGELIGKLEQPQESPLDIFNDLTLTPAGDAFVSGFGSRRIYRVPASLDRAQVLLTLPEGHYPNGIDLSPRGQLLFVATSGGVVVVDPGSADWYPLAAPAGESLAGIDGMYFFKDSLVAVQGERITRFHLSDGYDRVERVEVLDEGHPLFEQPTTGVIDDRFLYYIANSQFTKFDEQFRLAKLDELQNVVILRVPLE